MICGSQLQVLNFSVVCLCLSMITEIFAAENNELVCHQSGDNCGPKSELFRAPDEAERRMIEDIIAVISKFGVDVYFMRVSTEMCVVYFISYNVLGSK